MVPSTAGSSEDAGRAGICLYREIVEHDIMLRRQSTRIETFQKTVAHETVQASVLRIILD